MRVNEPSGILSPALMVINAPVNLSKGFTVQRPQLQNPWADIRNGLQSGKRLLGFSDVLQGNLGTAEIDIGFVQMLDLALLKTSIDGVHGVLIVAGTVINLAEF